MTDIIIDFREKELIYHCQLQNEKIKFTELILKWKQVYKTKGFWKKNLIEQINSLILLKSQVLSNFDNSRNGMSFGMSILPTMISDINNSKEYKDVTDFSIDDFSIDGYTFYEPIKMNMVA